MSIFLMQNCAQLFTLLNLVKELQEQFLFIFDILRVFRELFIHEMCVPVFIAVSIVFFIEYTIVHHITTSVSTYWH